jgi:hypothetical protein
VTGAPSLEDAADGPLTPEPLTPERVDRLVDGVADLLGFDTTGRRRVTFTNNAVIVLPAARAVLRVAGSPGVAARIPGVIAAAQWFAAHGIPAVRLWPGIPQPVHAGPHQVTVWREAPAGPVTPTPEDLATILKTIHAVPLPRPPGLPTWRIAEGIRRRLRHRAALTEADHAYLVHEADSVAAALEELRDVPPLVPPGVIHGDAHLGNLIPTPDGPVICDFDSSSVGPREWDLIPAAVGSIRFDSPVDVHAGLATAYGADVTGWAGFPILRRLRELQLVTSVIPVLAANPALRPQWHHRLQTYRGGDERAQWTPYADITPESYFR